ncbi:MAG: hypothetical protein AB7S26_28330 [Sandaracinaceae bacterium]
MPWREDDERLLRRQEDEALLARVWDALTPEGTAAPHARASGVMVALRDQASAMHAFDRARQGELAPLLLALDRVDYAERGPRHAHHLALLHAGVADALEPTDRTAALHARRRSLAAWLWLGSERRYLEELADGTLGTTLRGADRERAVAEAALLPIEHLGARAKSGAPTLSEGGAVAILALSTIDEAIRDSGCDDEMATRARRLADRWRLDAVDAALGPVADSLEHALLEAAPIMTLLTHVERALDVWRWCGREETAERFLTEKITPIIWDRHRERAWDDVRRIVTPLRPAVEHMARRIEGDPSRLAYAAPCAQMFVFMAEVAPRLEEQIVLAERAVALCATHRNGRLVLADLLVARALRRLEGAVPFGWSPALDESTQDISRAQELFPQLSRLEDAKKRLRRFGVDLDKEKPEGEEGAA